ncbi:MAG: regulatory iron-sulfur-containing complex subunit RicT [Flavobacteriales bacterium]
MGCSGCSTGGESSGGSCGTCHSKLPVFNWLSGINDPKQDIVEIAFKNGRKGFFRNSERLMLKTGDVVTVEGDPGHDVGVVSLAGAVVRLQLRKKKVDKTSDQIKKLYRKSTQNDIDKWHIARERENEAIYRTRALAEEQGLKMKISDVEFQGDNSKAIFFYTAEERVDFRELIKLLAREFNIRVEMRQIGARQESARLGGIGSCGRELCCSTWLTDFRTVNTNAARYQQLSLNPQKLAGQCGKLKCCLNYELESYVDALDGFPSQKSLKLKNGQAQFQKMDIFGGKMIYSVQEEFKFNWHELEIEKVKEVHALNAKGIYPENLDEFTVVEEIEPEIEFENVVGQDSLTRFDKSKGPNRAKRSNRTRHRKPPSANAKTKQPKNRQNQPNKQQATSSKQNQNEPRANQRNRKADEPSRPSKSEHSKGSNVSKPNQKTGKYRAKPNRKPKPNQSQETSPRSGKPRQRPNRGDRKPTNPNQNKAKDD